MALQLLSHARRVALAGTTGITMLVTYKAQTDPIHIFWDLDHTILCSICPIPKDANTTNSQTTDSNEASLPVPSPPTLEHFDQIDDDFPFDANTLEPNTRTYFRPGARISLQICSLFSVMHVYTAAQESYTNNILNKLDRKLFTKVLHRDDYPAIVKGGKDLSVTIDRMDRAILFDDKVSNFKPQQYQNGIGVTPFTSRQVEKCLNSTDRERWEAYLAEMKEMARLVGISLWSSVRFTGDVRKLVSWVRGWDDKK